MKKRTPIKRRKYFVSKYFSAMIVLSGVFLLLQIPLSAQNTQSTMSEKAGEDSSISIHQEFDFKASPQQVYKILLDSKQFSAFSAAAGFSATSAQIDSIPGGAFSLFDGHIIGRNIEMTDNKRIVQAWRVADWPKGIYSIAEFQLIPRAGGTHLLFDQTGFPKGLHDHLSEGWQTHYWVLMAKYLNKPE